LGKKGEETEVEEMKRREEKTTKKSVVMEDQVMHFCFNLF
jgi:hypothetical protein